MSATRLTVVRLEPPLSIALGPWAVQAQAAGRTLVVTGAPSEETAEALAARIECHESGGLWDPETGQRYLAPADPVRDQGRPSPEHVLEAIRVHEDLIREPCAAFVGVPPVDEEAPYPPCLVAGRCGPFAWAEETGHPLLEVFPVRCLSVAERAHAESLEPHRRACFTDLWWCEELETTWSPVPLRGAAFNALAREAEDAALTAWGGIVDLYLSSRDGKAPPELTKVASDHVRAFCRLEPLVALGPPLIARGEASAQVLGWCREHLAEITDRLEALGVQIPESLRGPLA